MWMTLYIAALFFVLTPGVLLALPPGATPLVQAAVHAAVFAIVWKLTHKAVWRALH